ncbi:hypothetical protein AAFM46_10940 [Arthrobacter sp. TMP15]|uniref:hypothetical protein n=1 Tax=Arthrobacter sp. TMP15 TaxID=3140789 RepID=UPI0031BB8556
MTTCTTPDCHRITSLYLCTDCIIELDDLLKDVDVLRVYLVGPLRRTSVTRAPGAGGAGGVAGSTPSISLDALLLQAWLGQLPARAHAEAMENPEAGQTLFMARLWVGQARDLVWGPEETRVYGECGRPLEGHEPEVCTEQLVASPDDASVRCQECGEVYRVADLLAAISVKVRGEPMAPRAVREYLQAKAKVLVSVFDFKNWVKHGKLPHVLDRVTTTERAPKLYYPGDVLTVYEDMQAKRRPGR